MGVVQPFHQRLAELYILNKQRRLTPAEMADLQHSLAANAKYCYEIAYLENLSLMASMTEDAVWQHQICAAIDDLQLAGQKKKPGRKKRDAD